MSELVESPAKIQTWPDVLAVAQPLVDKVYGKDECWRFVVELLEAGGFGRFADDPTRAVQQVQEVWFQDDVRDPLGLVQPWDWVLLRRPKAGPAVRHVGIVVNGLDFIHARETLGVRTEPLRRWQPWFVQIARLRCCC